MKMIKPPLLLSFFFITAICSAQEKIYSINLADFRDAAHHWYDIRDKGNTINPRPGHPVYPGSDISNIANNILLYQKNNGGWPKNYDVQAILSPEQKDSLLKAKDESNTTFDNGTTYAQIAYLVKAYRITRNEAYSVSAIRGLNYILAAQYANGGWPQYYPLEKNYSRYITFNDDAFVGVMKLLKMVADGNPDFSFLDNDHRKKLVVAYNKGLNCILATQVADTDKPTAWCQQYDETTLEPAWARKFEPPSICNGESVNIVLLLMDIDNPSEKIRNAIEYAVAWFEASKIYDTKVQTIDAPEMITPFTISKHDKVVVTSKGAPPIWTRYYELKTHRPMFCNRDSKIVYSLAEVDRERRDGYGWYTYEPLKILDRYPAWKKGLEKLE